ncbi:FAD-dependent oxidoreductase [Bordetella sp. BOR01]|uniref:FAD-dependent oxidoreductase n=1 Tax=Bordetella sp. BOR01 TaxID=2854779 RepID=UPI001C44AAA9|nr:FAD-dependent oxidoreductase [Bordetella sp. BOR01]MBV7483757.1 FAD-dependent oxidoreductase [Bordetella sp. BOR01]
MRQRRVVVIGAGVVGVVTAEALCDQGYAVTVVERNSEPAASTSAGNAGQLCGAFCLPFGAPGFLPSFLKKSFAGLGVGMSPGDVLANVRWLAGFMKNCGRDAFLRNSEAMLRLAHESVDALAALLGRHPLDFDYRKNCGKLYLYDSPDALESENLLLQLRRRVGYDVRVASESECKDIEPLLAGSKYRFSGGVYASDSSVGNCAVFTRKLAQRLAEQGVVFRYESAAENLVCSRGKVQGVSLREGVIDADIVVLASAVGTRALLPRSLRARFPVAPLKGYSVTLPLSGAGPRGTITDARRAVAFSVLGNQFRITGGAYLASSSSARGPQLDRILRVAQDWFPAAADYASGRTKGWAGLRPVTPASAPYIGHTGLPGLYINTGHGGFGWTCAAASARRLVAAID